MNTRAVVLAASAILGGVVLCAGAVFLLLHWWDVPAGAGSVQASPASAAPDAGLRNAPQQDQAAYRADKERRLHALGWVDAQRGIARIPIEAAMDLLAAGAAR